MCVCVCVFAYVCAKGRKCVGLSVTCFCMNVCCVGVCVYRCVCMKCAYCDIETLGVVSMFVPLQPTCANAISSAYLERLQKDAPSYCCLSITNCTISISRSLLMHVYPHPSRPPHYLSLARLLARACACSLSLSRSLALFSLLSFFYFSLSRACFHTVFYKRVLFCFWRTLSISKVARSYNNKGRRLVDIVRQSIVFENGTTVCMCVCVCVYLCSSMYVFIYIYMYMCIYKYVCKFLHL